jgi:hypothetical protein
VHIARRFGESRLDPKSIFTFEAWLPVHFASIKRSFSARPFHRMTDTKEGRGLGGKPRRRVEGRAETLVPPVSFQLCTGCLFDGNLSLVGCAGPRKPNQTPKKKGRPKGFHGSVPAYTRIGERWESPFGTPGFFSENVPLDCAKENKKARSLPVTSGTGPFVRFEVC